MQRLGPIVVVFLFGLSPFAFAERTSLGRLPGKPVKVGFTMSAELDAVAGNGYQPVYLTFSPLAKSFVRDRNLEILISPRNSWRTDLDFEFRQPVTVPEGVKKFSTVVYVPYYYAWDSVRLSLNEDGRAVESGSTQTHLSGLRTRYANQQVSVGIIEPHDMGTQDAPWKIYPDIRTLVTVLGEGPLPEDVDVKRLAHQAAMDVVKGVQPAWVQFRPIDEAALHDNWIGYSQLDVIIVAGPVLERIAQEQPQHFTSLQDWIANGGNLWVYAADGSEHGLEKIKTVAAMPGQLVAEKSVSAQLQLNLPNDTSELTYESWSGVQRASQQYAYQSDSSQTKRQDIFTRLEKQEHPFAKTVPTAQIASDVRCGSFGLGTLVTIGSEDPFPGSYQFWKSIAGLHPDGELRWIDRNGIDVPQGNESYWGWLIRSVGQPPVKSFVFLNTLFVIIVGPVCYYFFRRRQRLYLLYFFAPCLALLVTTGLFAYALVADGTRTKLRCRQLTWVDSANGYLVGQSRQTYYAVLGSRRGIDLPQGTAVYPIRNTPAVNMYSYGGNDAPRRGSYWVDSQKQKLTGIFLPPRSQVQYMIHRPQRVPKSIECSFSATAVEVTNHLPYAIERLVVCDPDGKYWQASQVDVGQTVTLSASDAKVLEKMLGPKVLPPVGTVPMLQKNQRWWGGTSPGTHQSVLEKRLQQWSKKLPAKSFVATADLRVDRMGVSRPVILDSVHVLLGDLP